MAYRNPSGNAARNGSRTARKSASVRKVFLLNVPNSKISGPTCLPLRLRQLVKNCSRAGVQEVFIGSPGLLRASRVSAKSQP